MVVPSSNATAPAQTSRTQFFSVGSPIRSMHAMRTPFIGDEGFGPMNIFIVMRTFDCLLSRAIR
jgi:hypothetical protein